MLGPSSPGAKELAIQSRGDVLFHIPSNACLGIKRSANSHPRNNVSVKRDTRSKHQDGLRIDKKFTRMGE